MASCRISVGLGGVKSTKPTERCVVIDVLRASSTIVTGLSHGVEEVRIVGSVSDALRLKEEGYTVAGERKCVPPTGFDLGNSPVELLRAVRKHPIKKIALSTSNLTRVLPYCQSAYICSSLNLTAVSRQIKGEPANVVAVGGPHGVVEDLAIALALMVKAQGVRLQKGIVQKMVRQSPAARHLVSIGYGEDIAFITSVDKYSIVPLYGGGMVTRLPGSSPDSG